MKRSAPLTRKTPLKPGKGLQPGTGFKRTTRTCSQAKDAHGFSPDLRDFALRELGCIACRLRGLGYVPAAKHHLLTTGLHGNGKRRGEAATIPLCDYHHQGAHAVGTLAARDYANSRGPSFADDARAFRAEFDDSVLLAETEKALAEWRRKTLGLNA